MNNKIKINHTHSWREVRDDEFLMYRNLGYVYNIATAEVIRYLDERDIDPPCEVTIYATGDDTRISGEEYVDVEVKLEII